MPGLASTTAAGLARRITPAQWEAVERGVAAVTGRMLDLLPRSGRPRCPAARSRSTWRLTDVEVDGPKSGAWPMPPGQRPAAARGGLGETEIVWPLTWATAR